jgi:hypothetical protein
MTNTLDLPPSVTVGPRSLGVSVITAHGATVSVLLPKPRGLDDIGREELLERATALARAALTTAASALALKHDGACPSAVLTPNASRPEQS